MKVPFGHLANHRTVNTVGHQWIPLHDGRRLAARIWLPENASAEPAPAVVECHPYGKAGARAVGDQPRHAWLASHGYAAVRVDIAGSGESEGILVDEYSPTEIDDVVEVIGWVAGQEWCTGSVGIFGISWSGFNSLQVAARRPPSLKAVISACASDDRYADDVHYLGGCIVAREMLSWSTTMLALTASPPGPAVTDQRRWLERLGMVEPLVHTWLSHQYRDGYWQQGSVSEDYGAITCPVLLVGGWADGYRDAILRLLEHLPGPTRAIIGPWGHGWPDRASPGPQIGFLQEALRWWDQWLKGLNTGVIDDPPLRAWMQDAVRPCPTLSVRPGRWVAEQAWPSPQIESLSLVLGDGTLGGSPVARPIRTHCGRLTPASEPGPWCAAGHPADHPGDQQGEDGQSLRFTTDPLATSLDILGVPTVTLQIAVDQPVALVVVRLCDIWPDGASTLVTRGVLNLTHFLGHNQHIRLVPGQPFGCQVPLQAIAYRVPAGHRLRLALASTGWPLVWPSPRLATLAVHTARSELLLPLRQASASEIEDPFEPPIRIDPYLLTDAEHFELFNEPTAQPSTTRWPTTGTTEISWPRNRPGIRVRPSRFGPGEEYCSGGDDSFSIVDDDPLSALATSTRSLRITRDDQHFQIEVTGMMSSTDREFVLEHSLAVDLDGATVVQRSWSARIPRQGV